MTDYNCDHGNGWSLVYDYLCRSFKTQSLRNYCFKQSLGHVPGAYSGCCWSQSHPGDHLK
jgi:hypothetical protein